MIRRTLLLGVCALAACAPTAPPPTLPSANPGSVLNDPIRTALQDAGTFFRRPQAGQPARAARAIADIEFLAGAVSSDPRWQVSGGAAQVQLNLARDEGRRALGIPASAPAQEVIDGLLAAANAIEANDQPGLARALPRAIFTAGPAQTVRRLAQPPRMPSAGSALVTLAAGPVRR
jgi:hypothetical protein